jgi:hypothetical protein
MRIHRRDGNIVQRVKGTIGLSLRRCCPNEYEKNRARSGTKVSTVLAAPHNETSVCDFVSRGLSELVYKPGDIQSLLESIEAGPHSPGQKEVLGPQQTVPGQILHERSRKMCHTEHVYHRACSHWGRERIVGGPCCRARIIGGRHTTCLYTENIGSANSSDPCSQCVYKLAQGDDWKPFEHVSNAAWARVEERLRQRRPGMSQPSSPVKGMFTTLHVDASCS